MQRRSFLAGLGALLAFPSAAKAFVKPENPLLMHYRGKSTFDAGLHYCPYVPETAFSIEKVQVTAKSRYIKGYVYFPEDA